MRFGSRFRGGGGHEGTVARHRLAAGPARYGPRGLEIIIYAALVGSAVFALASLVSPFHLEYGRRVGWVAVAFSLPYFSYASLVMRMRIEYVFHYEAWAGGAVLSWLTAALYLAIGTWRSRYFIPSN